MTLSDIAKALPSKLAPLDKKVNDFPSKYQMYSPTKKSSLQKEYSDDFDNSSPSEEDENSNEPEKVKKNEESTPFNSPVKLTMNNHSTGHDMELDKPKQLKNGEENTPFNSPVKLTMNTNVPIVDSSEQKDKDFKTVQNNIIIESYKSQIDAEKNMFDKKMAQTIIEHESILKKQDIDFKAKEAEMQTNLKKRLHEFEADLQKKFDIESQGFESEFRDKLKKMQWNISNCLDEEYSLYQNMEITFTGQEIKISIPFNRHLPSTGGFQEALLSSRQTFESKISEKLRAILKIQAEKIESEAKDLSMLQNAQERETLNLENQMNIVKAKNAKLLENYQQEMLRELERNMQSENDKFKRQKEEFENSILTMRERLTAERLELEQAVVANQAKWAQKLAQLETEFRSKESEALERIHKAEQVMAQEKERAAPKVEKSQPKLEKSQKIGNEFITTPSNAVSTESLDVSKSDHEVANPIQTVKSVKSFTKTLAYKGNRNSVRSGTG